MGFVTILRLLCDQLVSEREVDVMLKYTVAVCCGHDIPEREKDLPRPTPTSLMTTKSVIPYCHF